MNFLSLFSRDRQTLTEANNREIRDAIQRLVNSSTGDYGYYLFLVLSVLITAAGLLLNAAPVIIGGMIIAPLLIPLLGCSLAILLFEGKGFMRSLAILLLSIVITLSLSAGMTYVVTTSNFDINYIPPRIPWQLYLIIAVASGVAGTYAYVKEHLSSSISGVAVSVSLLPPLCAVGIGIALHVPSLVRGAILIFLLNVAGIIAASVIVFWILGFRRAREIEERAVERVEGEG